MSILIAINIVKELSNLFFLQLLETISTLEPWLLIEINSTIDDLLEIESIGTLDIKLVKESSRGFLDPPLVTMTSHIKLDHIHILLLVIRNRRQLVYLVFRSLFCFERLEDLVAVFYEFP